MSLPHHSAARNLSPREERAKRVGGPLGNTQAFRPPPPQRGGNAEKPGRSPAAERSRLAWALRPHQRDRQAKCRLVRIAPDVQLVGRVAPDGRGSLIVRGVATCGSVHTCPHCAAAITSRRSAELSDALGWCRRDRVLLTTFTLRHDPRMPLRFVRRLLANAYGELKAGAQGRRLKETLGYVGDVRAAEVTWGASAGWHPHLHALWFLQAVPPEGYERTLAEAWQRRVSRAFVRLREKAFGADVSKATLVQVLGRYYANNLEELRAVLRQLDVSDILPDLEHGVRAEQLQTDTAAAVYLQKMGLEVSGMMNKTGNPGHYTSWGIAHAVAAGQEWAPGRWREFAGAMFGARQLTWSRKLRWWLGLDPERPDAELAMDEPEPGAEETLLSVVPGSAWDLMVREHGAQWLAELHEQYESGTLDPNARGRPVVKTPKPPDVAPMWWERWGGAPDFRRGWAKHFRQRAERAARWAGTTSA